MESTKSEREKSERELAWALEALTDGVGHEEWGPGPVVGRLRQRDGFAAAAFAMATKASYRLLGDRTPGDMTASIRELAPVFLRRLRAQDDQLEGKALVFLKGGLVP